MAFYGAPATPSPLASLAPMSSNVTNYPSSIPQDYDSEEDDYYLQPEVSPEETPKTPEQTYVKPKKSKTNKIPLYEHPSKDTKLSTIQAGIENASDPRTCPLVMVNNKLLQLVILHYTYVNCCLPVPIRMNQDPGEEDGSGYECTAEMVQVSGNFTKQRSMFKGKRDYSDASSVFRDLYWATWGQKFSKDGESRERGWDYLEVYVPPVRELQGFGRTSYRLFDIDFTNGGWIPINHFIPSYLRIQNSATNFILEKLPRLLREGAVPANYLPEGTSLDTAISVKSKSLTGFSDDRFFDYNKRKNALNNFRDEFVPSTFIPYKITTETIPTTQDFDKKLVLTINKLKSCSSQFAMQESSKRKIEMCMLIAQIDNLADSALFGAADNEAELQTETTVENLRSSSVAVKAITYPQESGQGDQPAKKRRKRRLLKAVNGPLFPDTSAVEDEE